MPADTTPAPTEVLVRFEIATLGHAWYDRVRVTRTPLVDALISRGALTVLDGEGDAPAEATTDAPVAAPSGPGTAVSWFGPETAPQG